MDQKNTPSTSLRDLKERADRAKKIQRMMEELEVQLVELEEEADRLGAVLDKEEADVERLKNMDSVVS